MLHFGTLWFLFIELHHTRLLFNLPTNYNSIVTCSRYIMTTTAATGKLLFLDTTQW